MALLDERACVVSNDCVGPNLYLMTLSAPGIANAVQPGQFVHMKVPGMEAHVLRRPFSVYARDAKAGTIDVLYQTVGFGTELMTQLVSHGKDGCEGAGLARREGDGCDVSLIGPVGHGWQAPQGATRALLVGGGVGAAPLFMLCERLRAQGVQADVVLGAQTASALVCRGRYEKLLAGGGANAVGAAAANDGEGTAGGTAACEGPRCATDDGSFGRSGFCTSLVEEALAWASAEGNPYGYVAVCGPEPLMKIVAHMASEAGVPCEVSLERRMACGVGACLSCVVDTVDGKKRACVDGPVFDAAKVVW